jgi:FKBP-type peptidyl-prolyl cis-trans isomerase FkpA
MKRHLFLNIFLLFSFLEVIILSSCDPEGTYLKEEKELIDSYIAGHPSFDFILKPSGLYYYDIIMGSGPFADTHDTAYLLFTGKFLDGTEFDSNVGIDTAMFILNEGYGISGFNEGLTYMKEGGKALFLIPSNLGYGTMGINYIGNKGTINIGGYTPLLFEVELVKLIKYIDRR